LLKYSSIGFEVFTAMAVKGSLLWNITPYSPLKVNGNFEETHFLYLQDQTRNRLQAVGSKQSSASSWFPAQLGWQQERFFFLGFC
jgi:hypothetical protein